MESGRPRCHTYDGPREGAWRERGRLPRPSTELTVCYVGVSFYRSLDKQALLTSVAQVFNERGEGVVVRGGHASISKEDRQAHLPENHAHELLKNALGSNFL